MAIEHSVVMAHGYRAFSSDGTWL